MTETLADLRLQVRAIDEQILQLVASRLDLARQIGTLKQEAKLPIKDYGVEKEVLNRSRAKARELGIYPSLAEDLARLMIQYAVAAQDDNRQRQAHQRSGPARNVVIVGGRGRMGGWLSEFFDAFGHHVSHVDPSAEAGAPSPFPVLSSLEGALSADLIVLATPIATTATVIEELASRGTKALVFDICSLKTPLIPAIHKARQRGLRVGSVHPMFGPDADVLAGRTIMICDVGDPTVTAATRALFEPTTATLTEVPLERHDQLMSYVLGLSHLSNLVFAEVLATSGEPYSELQGAASTTFNAQLDVTRPVTKENPELYYEIQAENAFTPQLVAAFDQALKAYAQAVHSADRSAFRQLMERGRRYFAET